MKNLYFVRVSYRELHEAIKKLLKGPTAQAAFHARYIGAQGHEKRTENERSSLIFWGHKVPVLRSTSRAIVTRFTIAAAEDDKNVLSRMEEFDLWRRVWKESDVYEVRSIALSQMLSKRLADVRLQLAPRYLELVFDIDNWAHSDELSAVLSDLLEKQPRLLETFRTWNEHRNPWVRRQSLVGLYFYSRFRTRPLSPKISLPLVKRRLLDEHFYVQRGVGWALREIDRVDSKMQRAFVEKHLHEISSTAWFATTELYPTSLRTELALRRRAGRKAKIS